MSKVERGSKMIEVSLSGNGGQGLILMALILAEAAGIHDGKQVVQTQTYGAESRGGLCRADVIIADGEVDRLQVEHPDVLLVMSDAAASQYVGNLKAGGVLVVDSSEVRAFPPTRVRTYQIPFTQLAREQLGRALYANIVALGAIIELVPLVSAEAARAAVLARAPRGTEDANLVALELGRELGQGASVA
jgi:2-oxoglutarate ferredoxin oxidoreductase subunit gamma